MLAPLEPVLIRGAIVVLSALAWAGVVIADHRWMAYADYDVGVSIMYLPAGVRMIALLIGGAWAALGISIASLFLVGEIFRTSDSLEIVLLSVFPGLIPYLSLVAALKLLRISPDLRDLSSIHLPFISLGVGLGSSLGKNLLYTALGYQGWSELAANVLAKTFGEVLGCLIAVSALLVILKTLRQQRA